MRKVFSLTAVVEHGHATVATTFLLRVGGTTIEVPGYPELDFLMDEEEPDKQLFKDVLVHVIEHL